MKQDVWSVWGRRLRSLLDRYKFVLLVILVGTILLLLPSTRTGGTAQVRSEPADEQNDLFSVETLERRLEEALSQIDGAGEVEVVLTLKSSARQILAQDSRSSSRETGDAETQIDTVVVSQGSGEEQTVALQQVSPEYQGALVVCSGGGDPSVRLRIVESVSALTGLGADRISVCKGK